ncbi:hypothetical protein [Peribacillus simplex]|uniref:hypothetical protein n=1 Tax=Peribacillus simplex TaxID=1478 RepID=UPI003D29557C
MTTEKLFKRYDMQDERDFEIETLAQMKVMILMDNCWFGIKFKQKCWFGIKFKQKSPQTHIIW